MHIPRQWSLITSFYTSTGSNYFVGWEYGNVKEFENSGLLEWDHAKQLENPSSPMISMGFLNYTVLYKYLQSNTINHIFYFYESASRYLMDIR